MAYWEDSSDLLALVHLTPQLKLFVLIVMGEDGCIYAASYALLCEERAEDIENWLRAIAEKMERAGTPWHPSAAFIDASAAEQAAIG